MKKTVALLICLLLIAALSIPALAAEDPAVTITPGSSTAAPGDLVTFTVSISGAAAFNGFGLRLSYDTDRYELVSGTCTAADTAIADFNKDRGFLLAFFSPKEFEGEIGQFTLRVKDACSPASTSVDGIVSIKNGNIPIAASVTAAQVALSGEHSFVDGVCKTCGILGGSCGEKLFWTLDKDGTLTIYGEGEPKETPELESHFADVTGLAIGDKVSDLPLAASDLPKLQAVTVADGNDTYSSVDGVLLSADGSELLGYPIGKPDTEYTVPDTVRFIGEAAFAGAKNLTAVTVPETVSAIGASAFAGCTGLETFTVPESVTSVCADTFNGCSGLKTVTLPESIIDIFENAFAGCTSLTDVYYGGTRTLWNTTKIYEGNESLQNATIHCPCGDDHDLIPHDGKPATCTEAGWEAYSTCSRCTYTTYTKIEAQGHDLVNHIAKTPTCTEAGWSAYDTCSRCNYSTYMAITELGHDLGEWVLVIEPSPEAAGQEKRSCSRCDFVETREVPFGGRLELDGELAEQSVIWVDGAAQSVYTDAQGNAYAILPEDASRLFVTYSHHVASDDVHTQYPTGMKVYRIHEQENGSFTAEEIPALENLLRYSGSSIRITGNKGIRMITSVDKALRSQLTGSGVDGYKLLEYGTALCWASDLEGGKPMTLGQDYIRSNYAYKRGVADPVFQYAGNLIQYTNVLVGFTTEQCKDDIAMRSYIILEDAEGETVTLYGGIVYRSIGYIAWQNQNVFKPGTTAYDYVWEIIHAVYGEDYTGENDG